MQRIEEERMEAWSFGWKDHFRFLPEAEDLECAKARIARYHSSNMEGKPSDRLAKEINIIQWSPENHRFRSLKSLGVGPQHLCFISEELLEQEDYILMDREQDAHKQLTRRAVFSMGRNKGGQLGHPNKDPLAVPTRVDGLWHLQIDTLEMSCGPIHNAAIVSDALDRSENKLYVWGQNYFGRLGVGDTLIRLRPKLVETLIGRSVTQVSCGENHTACVTSDGVAWAWGYNRYLQCGVNRLKKPEIDDCDEDAAIMVPTPIRIAGFAVKIACGFKHTLVLNQAGMVYGLGSNERGQLGTTTYVGYNYSDPQHVSTISGIREIGCNRASSMALSATGEMYSWGAALQAGHIAGMLQTGMTAKVVIIALPKPIPALKTVKIEKFTCAPTHTLAIDKNRNVWTWGYNRYGQCGFASLEHLDPNFVGKTDVNVPTRLRHLRDVSDVFANCGECSGHSFAFIKGTDALLRQHTRDGNYERFYSLASSLSKPEDYISRRDYKGRNVIDWAAKNGANLVLNKALMILASRNVAESIVNQRIPSSGDTPLHLCARYNHPICARMLLQHGAKPVSFNNLKELPLHIAIEKENINVAKILCEFSGSFTDSKFHSVLVIPDGKGKRVVDCGSLEMMYSLKVIDTNFADCVLMYTGSKQKILAQELKKELSKQMIKCWDCPDFKFSTSLPVAEVQAEMEKRILRSKALLFLVGPDTITDDSVNGPKTALAIAKDSGRTIVPLWEQKVNLPVDLESIIFRYQILDMSSNEEYLSSISSLIQVIHDLILNSDDDDDPSASSGSSDSKDFRSETTDADQDPNAQDEATSWAQTQHLPLSEQTIFVTYCPSDSSYACGLIDDLEYRNIVRCVHPKALQNDETKMGVAARNCYAMLFIMSSASINNSQVFDLLTLAENNGRPIIVLRRQRVLDDISSGLAYMIANCPVVYDSSCAKGGSSSSSSSRGGGLGFSLSSSFDGTVKTQTKASDQLQHILESLHNRRNKSALYRKKLESVKHLQSQIDSVNRYLASIHR